MYKIGITNRFNHAWFHGIGRFQRHLRGVNHIQHIGHILDVESNLDGDAIQAGVNLSDVVARFCAGSSNNGVTWGNLITWMDLYACRVAGFAGKDFCCTTRFLKFGRA